MKRILCMILAMMMLLSMAPSASAITIAEGTSYVPNPMDLPLILTAGARLTETPRAEYVEGALDFEIGANEREGVDYKAKLDMSTIRALFEEGFMTAVLPDDREAKNEFNRGIVTTTINVLIDYPDTAIIKDGVNLASKSVGKLDAGNIFSEKSRVVDGSQAKITYVNKANLTVKELAANVNTYLKDITFTLDDVISYSEEGNHLVKITLSGETLIDFESKDQTVIYSGAASVVVNVAKNGEILNHELVAISVVPATCFETGLTEGIICKTHNSYGECGALGTKRQEIIPPYGHQIGGVSMKMFVPAVPATCLSKGIRAHWTCTLCKSDFDSAHSDEIKPHEEYVTPTAPHTEAILPAVSPTCTTIGFEEGKYCTVCGKVTKAHTIISALGHRTVTLPAVNPTCFETGLTSGLECRVCHVVLSEQAVIPKLEHKFSEWEIVREATEQATGLMKRYCLHECGTEEERVIEKKPHRCQANPDLAVVIKEATCTEKGLIQNYCDCGKPVGKQEKISAKGHVTEKVDSAPATCVSEGVIEHYTCVVCELNFRDSEGKKKLNSITQPKDKNNHGDENFVEIHGVEPTCYREGLTAGEKCKNCNIVTVPQEVIPMISHTLVDVEYKAPNCEEHGIKEHKHCSVCNKDFDMSGEIEWTEIDFDIDATGHSYGPAEKYPEEQEIVDGHYDGVKRCTNHGCTSVIPVKIVAVQEECRHNTTLTIITKPATCTEKGHKETVCVSCGIATGSDVAKLPHNLIKIDSVPSTCTTQGTAAYYRCQICGKMYEGVDASKEIHEPQKLDKTTHNFRIIGNGNNKQCIYCHEVVHIKVKDKDGNDDHSGNVNVNTKNVGIKNDKDAVKEESHNDIEDHISIVSEITVSQKEEASPELAEVIDATIPEVEETEVVVEKAVWEIEIEKTTTYHKSGEVDIEQIKELEDLIEVTITIPEELMSMIDYLVHRKHYHEDGQMTIDVLTTKPNEETGEYIEIKKSKAQIILHVKRFSEYAVVGYSTVVNDEPSPGTGSIGHAPHYSVKFKANGGTLVGDIYVAAGKPFYAPEVTREGYILEGWYLDSEYTKKFEFGTPIDGNIILYAKWIVDDGCDGTLGDGCPALKFTDVDTTEWYHLGVDYVVDHNLMIGVEIDKFAPYRDLTRGMIVTILGRREGVEDGAALEQVFADVYPEDYYSSHIDWAEANGIVLGYGNGNYGPGDSITREQLAAIMYRYMTYKGIKFTGESKPYNYADADKISGYAKEAVQFCSDMGIMMGIENNKFNPTGKASRAEIATVMLRTFGKYN